LILVSWKTKRKEMTSATTTLVTRADSRLRLASAPVSLVKLLVLVSLMLCMSAPEELAYSADDRFYTDVMVDLNPFVGAMKLTLLGLAFAILILCRRRRRHWAIAAPFALLIPWAVLCWVVAGASIFTARNLVSTFGGILVLAALCAAAEYVGGIRAMVRMLVWALALTVAASVLLGLLGLQAMPGQLPSPWQMEWFHGVGLPGYALAGCAALIAWVLGRYLSGPGVRLEGAILLLLLLPALAFLRTYLIGMVVSIVFAMLVAFRRSRRRRHGSQIYEPGCKRLLFLVTATLAIASVVFFLKTTSRSEENALSGREIVWPIEIASVIQHPVFGLGPFGDVELLRFKEDLPQVGSAHSDYLGAAVCYGIPGLLLFLGALYGIWRRTVRYAPATIDERACRYAALISLVGLSTTIIAENVLHDPRLFTLHLLFPALCLSTAMRRKVTVR
jgi:O-antigen ligase